MQNDRNIENGWLFDPSYDDPVFIGKCLQCEISKLYADDEVFEDIDGNRICQKCFYEKED
jgi:hypothetical protein